MKTHRNLAFKQLIQMLQTVATFFGLWVLPIVVLLVLFGAVALMTRGHYPLVQRIYTYF